MRSRILIVCSLIFTFVFFREYLPGRNRVHIPYDLEGYHYPLASYAFEALRHGRFPQWDPTIYSGMSFVDNPQTALFYPPQWLAFLFSLRFAQLPYQAMQILTFAHVWLAFLLCCFWLRRQKRLSWTAAMLGGGAFAFSGFLMTQLQHLGLVGSYTWIPLGFWGIDQADERSDWRPLWKLALAFTLCILAGYPSMWVVFAICMAAYGLFRKRTLRLTAWVTATLLVCALFAAVQVLPATEAAGYKTPEAKYSRSSGIKYPSFYVSFAVPNYYNFNLKTDILTNFGQDYMYLGAPALVGLALLLRKKRLAGTGPLLAVLAASLFFEVNPFGLFGRAIEGTPLDQVFSAYYFLAGITAACAPLAAIGLDAGLSSEQKLRSERKLWPGVIAWVAIGLTIAWSVHLIQVFKRDAFATNFASVYDALAGVALAGVLVAAAARSRALASTCAAAALIVLAGCEYKAYGTSKRFDAARMRLSDIDFTSIRDIADDTRQLLLSHPEYRLAFENGSVDVVNLRTVGLSSPQGYDPLIPAHYQQLASEAGHFNSGRTFALDPENETALRLLGVRFFRVSPDNHALIQQLEATGKFHLLPPGYKYFHVYELIDATPAFGWEQPDSERSVQMTAWKPEQRAFRVNSTQGGMFRLSEEDLPGWKAAVDGRETPIERCHEALQCVNVGSGEHTLEFRYQSRWLVPGALVSLISMLMTVGIFRFTRGPSGSIPDK